MPPRRRAPKLQDQAVDNGNGKSIAEDLQCVAITHDDPETVFAALNSYALMRRRDRPAFLCQLSATLDTDQKRAVLRQLRPLLSLDIAMSLVGPAPNLFDTRPFLGEVKGLKSPWGFEEDNADKDDSDDGESRIRRCKTTPKGTGTGERAAATAKPSPSEPNMVASAITEVIGPLKFRPHVHRTTPAVQSADLTPAERDRLDSAMASVFVTQRQGYNAAKRRRIPGGADKVDVLCDRSTLVTYHVRKMGYLAPQEDRWRRRHEYRKKAGLLERDEKEREAHSQKLFELVAKLSQEDCWLLSVHVMCNWLSTPEATEHAMYFADCVRQRLNERSFWEQAPQDLIARILRTLRPHDACRAAKVCRNWRKILEDHIDPYWRNNTLELGRAYQIDDLPGDIEMSRPTLPRFYWKWEYHRWDRKLREPPRIKDLHKMNPSRLKLLLLIFRAAAWKIGREACQKKAERRLEKAAQKETNRDGAGAFDGLTEPRLKFLMTNTLRQAKEEQDEDEEGGEALAETGEGDVEADGAGEADEQNRSRDATPRAEQPSSTSPTVATTVAETPERTADEEKIKVKAASAKLPPLPSAACEMRLGTAPEKRFKECVPYKLAKQKVERGQLRRIDDIRVRSVPRLCTKLSLVRQIESPNAGGVNCVCLDRRRVMCGCVDGSIRIWSIVSARFITSYKPHKGSVRCIDTHDELIASGSWDTSIFVYHAVRCEVVKEVTGHTGTVASIRLTERFLITGSGDCTLRLWSTATWQLLSLLTGHKDEIVAICTLEAALPSNAMLATASADGSVRKWDFTFPVAGSEHAPANRPSGERRPAGSRRRQVLELQPRHVAATSKALYGQPGPLLCMQVMGGLMVVGDMRGWVTFIDWREGRVVDRICAHAQAVLSLDIADEWLVTCGLGKVVRQWSLKTGQCVRQLAGHSDAIKCVKWMGEDIVTASLDRVARIWTDTDPFLLVQGIVDEVEQEEEEDEDAFGSVEEDVWIALPEPEEASDDGNLWDDLIRGAAEKSPAESVPVRSAPEFRDESKRIEVKQAVVMDYDTCEPFVEGFHGANVDASLLKLLQLGSGTDESRESV